MSSREAWESCSTWSATACTSKSAPNVFELVVKWRPHIVFYEQYGMLSDEQHIYVQHERNRRFTIKPVGGATDKIVRIRRLMSIFERARITFPRAGTKLCTTGARST